MQVILGRYTIDDTYRMISAIGEQQNVDLWDYVIDKNNRYWFWPLIHREPGAMVHVGEIRAGQKSEGYGGATLTFSTKDGDISIQGPWHSNTDALYKATGVDLRDKHLTWGIISKDRTHNEKFQTIMVNVIHIDPKNGIIGTFERIEDLAKKIAEETQEVVYYFRRSSSGSSCGPSYPKGQEPWVKKNLISSRKR